MNFDLRVFGFAHPMNRCLTTMQRSEVVPIVIGEGGLKCGYNVSYYTVFDYYDVVAQGRFVSPEPQIILTRFQTNNVTQLYALRVWYINYKNYNNVLYFIRNFQ